MKSVSININSLEEFYAECKNIEPGGNKGSVEEVKCYAKDNYNFIGLRAEELEEYKYNYVKGLDKLKAIEKDIQLGGSKHTFKYADDDGDEMNYDRFLEGLPYLHKRCKTHGNKNGKFVNLHISVGENADISWNDMLKRSYTAMRIIDYLESNGYRIQVSVFVDNMYPGKMRNNCNYEEIAVLHTEVVIKKYEDPLIKGKILTAISPWFLRYWMFMFWNAKFVMYPGYGHATTVPQLETKSDIYINTGEALNDAGAENTINRIIKLFDKEDDLRFSLSLLVNTELSI